MWKKCEEDPDLPVTLEQVFVKRSYDLLRTANFPSPLPATWKDKREGTVNVLE